MHLWVESATPHSPTHKPSTQTTSASARFFSWSTFPRAHSEGVKRLATGAAWRGAVLRDGAGFRHTHQHSAQGGGHGGPHPTRHRLRRHAPVLRRKASLFTPIHPSITTHAFHSWVGPCPRLYNVSLNLCATTTDGIQFDR